MGLDGTLTLMLFWTRMGNDIEPRPTTILEILITFLDVWGAKLVVIVCGL